MLHYETIAPETLGLLKKLQKINEFKPLRLVGGTALALQIGHRKSIDIDLFGQLETDDFELKSLLNSFGEVINIKKSKNIKIFMVNGIKTDFVNYPFSWLKPPISEDDIVMADIEDIAPMKLEAVIGRGTKKDFIDIYFLLKRFSLKEMIELYKKKFKVDSEFMVLRSLSFFDDAEKDEFPDMIIQVSWETIKSEIRNALKLYEI